MRAEAQANADQINAALALLRRFLDWDRALKRLGELNAKVEDQALWNDPKAAQEVMRERRRLEEAIAATRAIESELNAFLEACVQVSLAFARPTAAGMEADLFAAPSAPFAWKPEPAAPGDAQPDVIVAHSYRSRRGTSGEVLQ